LQEGLYLERTKSEIVKLVINALYVMMFIGWSIYSIKNGTISFGQSDVKLFSLYMSVALLMGGIPLLIGAPPVGLLFLVASFGFYEDFTSSLSTFELNIEQIFYNGVEYLNLVMAIPLLVLLVLVIKEISKDGVKPYLRLLALIAFSFCILYGKFYYLQVYTDLPFLNYILLQISISFFIAYVSMIEPDEYKSDSYCFGFILFLGFVLSIVFIDKRLENLSAFYLFTLVFPLFIPFFIRGLPFIVAMILGVLLSIIYLSFFTFDFPYNDLGLIAFILFLFASIYGVLGNQESEKRLPIVMYMYGSIYLIVFMIEMFGRIGFDQDDVADVIVIFIIVGVIGAVIGRLKVVLIGIFSVIMLAILADYFYAKFSDYTQMVDNRFQAYTKVTKKAQKYYDRKSKTSFALIPVELGIHDFNLLDEKEKIAYKISGLVSVKLNKKGKIVAYKNIETLDVKKGKYNKFDKLYIIHNLEKIKTIIKKEDNKLTDTLLNINDKEIVTKYNSDIFSNIRK
jgi:hypothetical protein